MLLHFFPKSMPPNKKLMKLGLQCKFTNGYGFVNVPKMCQETLIRPHFKIYLDSKIVCNPED